MKVIERGKRKYNTYSFNIATRGEDWDHEKTNMVSIHLFKWFVYFTVPEFIKPKTIWVDLSKADWATPDKNGVKGYWNHIRKEYGFTISEGALHLHYGIQPGSWCRDDPENSDHTKVVWIPWQNKRHVRRSFYDVVNQSHLKSFYDVDKIPGISMYDKEREFQESLRHLTATFNDFDGEEIIAKLHIEEREWRHGIGAFKWLSWFVKPTIQRSLMIDFNKETGYEKGTWKGGTIGHSIEMMKGESAQSAFNRYASAIDRYRNHGRKPRNFSNVRFDYE